MRECFGKKSIKNPGQILSPAIKTKVNLGLSFRRDHAGQETGGPNTLHLKIRIPLGESYGHWAMSFYLSSDIAERVGACSRTNCCTDHSTSVLSVVVVIVVLVNVCIFICPG